MPTTPHKLDLLLECVSVLKLLSAARVAKALAVLTLEAVESNAISSSQRLTIARLVKDAGYFELPAGLLPPGIELFPTTGREPGAVRRATAETPSAGSEAAPTASPPTA